jgi:flagellar protein FliS
MSMNEAYQNLAYSNSNLTSYVEQKTLSASPLELVAMLYAKAISEIREAKAHLAARNIALRSKAISKACDAIGELDGSLNMKAGGELAERLRGLYRYCLVRLLDANLQQVEEPLTEVLGLLVTLSEGWQTIAKNGVESASRSNAPIPSDPLPGASTGHVSPELWGETEREASDRAHSWTL